MKYSRARAVASTSFPANTATRRSGFAPARSSASATPGRARPAAQPQTEFTTTSAVPGAPATASSSAPGVRASMKPSRVSSARIGATIRSS